jgi:hypothetical protein
MRSFDGTSVVIGVLPEIEAQNGVSRAVTGHIAPATLT